MDEFIFEECHIKVIKRDAKVVVLIEHSKPTALIALAAFIHILGEPLNHCYEKDDWGVLFLFEDKRSTQEIREKWAEIFGVPVQQK